MSSKIQVSDATAADIAKEEDEKTATMLPEPTGYRMLCACPEIDDKFEGGIYKATNTIHVEEVMTTVLFVLKMGPDCYKDEKRFPSGPWCKEGDFVVVRPHAGTKVQIFDKAFRIINDDSVEAVVQDPRGIRRGMK